MKPEFIAQTLLDISQEYLNGDLELEVYRPMCGALIFSLLGITPKQSEAMLNAAKMEIVTERLKNIEVNFNEESKKEDGKS